jgi:hypothetical protein
MLLGWGQWIVDRLTHMLSEPAIPDEGMEPYTAYDICAMRLGSSCIDRNKRASAFGCNARIILACFWDGAIGLNVVQKWIVDRLTHMLSEPAIPDEGIEPYTAYDICAMRLEVGPKESARILVDRRFIKSTMSPSGCDGCSITRMTNWTCKSGLWTASHTC